MLISRPSLLGGRSKSTKIKTMSNSTIDAALATTGSKATYTGSGMVLSGWLFSSEFAVLMGIVIGVAGFLVNWYYRHKMTNAEIKIKLDELQLKQQQAEREKAEHDCRMKSMRHAHDDHDSCSHEEGHCKYLPNKDYT